MIMIIPSVLCRRIQDQSSVITHPHLHPHSAIPHPHPRSIPISISTIHICISISNNGLGMGMGWGWRWTAWAVTPTSVLCCLPAVKPQGHPASTQTTLACSVQRAALPAVCNENNLLCSRVSPDASRLSALCPRGS